MATPEEIAERVKAIIVDQLGVNLEEVTPQASFIEDLGADSLDIVELIMALEEEYEMEIPDEDAEDHNNDESRCHRAPRMKSSLKRPTIPVDAI